MFFAAKPCRRNPFLRVLLAVLFTVCGTAVFAGHAAAQTAADLVKVTAALPPDSRAVIDSLSRLQELPDGAWKMHAGDLAHGEAVEPGRERLAGHRQGKQGAQ